MRELRDGFQDAMDRWALRGQDQLLRDVCRLETAASDAWAAALPDAWEVLCLGLPYRDADAEILAVREQACPEPGALELQAVGSAWLQQGASAPYTRGAARSAA